MSAQEANVSGRRRTPRGEQPPQATVHNLLKPPKLEKPLPAGATPEALHHGTHQSRITRYRKAIATLQRLIEDDYRLEARVKAAQDATFPGGNSAEGARSTDISDPTGGAATSGRIKDAAERAWASADAAMKALWWAETHRKRAETVSASETPEAQERFAKELAQLTGKKKPVVAEILGCTNCGKVGEFAPRALPPTAPKDSTLCRWCHEFQREHAIAPPRALLRKHHRGERIYTRDIDAALHGVQPQSAVG